LFKNLNNKKKIYSIIGPHRLNRRLKTSRMIKNKKSKNKQNPANRRRKTKMIRKKQKLTRKKKIINRTMKMMMIRMLTKRSLENNWNK